MPLDLGQIVRVTVDSLPDQPFTGTISFISSQAEFIPGNVQTSDDRATQVYRVRVALNEGGERLRPGMTVDLWLDSPGQSP
jgi:multidrug efflux pump subunit AcrA (membrane-fusion protein)